MWIGFSAVEGAEAGPVVQGAAFSLESCQNWLPGEPHPATAERCVRLGPAGQCNTDLCSEPHSYVCELRPGGVLGPRWWGHLSWMEGVSPKHGRELPTAVPVLPRPQGPPPDHAGSPGCPFCPGQMVTSPIPGSFLSCSMAAVFAEHLLC